MDDFKDLQNSEQRKNVNLKIKVAERVLRVKQARNKIIPFAKLMMPHPDDPDDATRSKYHAAQHHKAMAAALEEVEKGTIPRLIVTLPPRHGKSQLVCKTFIPWYMAHDPYRSVIFATYNQDFAEDFGADIRTTMQHPSFKQVFPHFNLKKGGQAKGRLQTEEGGMAVFVGRGGTTTGRGADLLIIDDLIKDAKEAESPTVREDCWEWFTKVAMTRLMTMGAGVVIVMTRWHEDDIVGRLTDPENPCYSKEEAKKWKVIDLPAIAIEDDALNREPGEPLWPARFPLEFLQAQKTLNPRGFSALYQQNPTPEDGDYFKRDWIKYYDMNKTRWKDLRIYAASDHAVGKDKSRNDQTVLLIVGLDEQQNIFIIDTWFGRETPDIVIDRMIDLMQAYNPINWYAERGHITQSIGPYLTKRMHERSTFCTVTEMTPTQNKEQRAQSIRGRMASGKVYFPRQKPWVSDMVGELLKFPNGKHDDFVDPLAYIGLALNEQYGASKVKEEEAGFYGPKIGTIKWIKENSDRQRHNERRAGSGELL